MPMNPTTKNILIFAGGVAVGVALPIVVPAVIEGGRPLIKSLVKHGSQGFQRLQVLAGRVAESLEDLLAEVRSEVHAAQAEAAGGAPVAPEPAVPSVGIPNPVSAMADKKVFS